MPTSLGPAEILVILIVALIVLGPERLPKAAKQLGKAVGEVRRWSSNVQEDLRSALDAEEEDPFPPIAAVPDPSDEQPETAAPRARVVPSWVVPLQREFPPPEATAPDH